MTKWINQQSIIRMCMVTVVIGLIGLFLYSPRLFYFLRKEKSITILAWPQVLDASYLQKFEQETGIKVYIRYFENNEELLMKLESTQGQGYDLIMPTDHLVEQLIKEGLIKKLDKAKITFWHTLHPALVGHYFDPRNEYTVPFYWGIFGLGIDKDYFKGKEVPASWSLLFDKRIAPDRVVMVDDVRELVLIAAYYLFGSIDGLTDKHIALIKQLLRRQKKWVYGYTDLRAEYLVASKTSPVVLVLSADIARVMPFFDHIDFVVPREGSFLIIDSFAFCKASEKEELVYQFLNYIYRPDVLQHYVDKFGFFPPTVNVRPTFVRRGLSMPTDRMIRKLVFFKNVLPDQALNDVWISLKA